MKTIIDPKEYKYVHQLSSHDCKYYTRLSSNEMIIEECDDNGNYQYYDGNWRYLGESPDSVFDTLAIQ